MFSIMFRKVMKQKNYDYGVPSRNMAANLTGKKAPEWTLNDIKESPVSLSDLKSKVILVKYNRNRLRSLPGFYPFSERTEKKVPRRRF